MNNTMLDLIDPHTSPLPFNCLRFPGFAQPMLSQLMCAGEIAHTVCAVSPLNEFSTMPATRLLFIGQCETCR